MSWSVFLRFWSVIPGMIGMSDNPAVMPFSRRILMVWSRCSGLGTFGSKYFEMFWSVVQRLMVICGSLSCVMRSRSLRSVVVLVRRCMLYLGCLLMVCRIFLVR